MLVPRIGIFTNCFSLILLLSRDFFPKVLLKSLSTIVPQPEKRASIMNTQLYK